MSSIKRWGRPEFVNGDGEDLERSIIMLQFVQTCCCCLVQSLFLHMKALCLIVLFVVYQWRIAARDLSLRCLARMPSVCRNTFLMFSVMRAQCVVQWPLPFIAWLYLAIGTTRLSLIVLPEYFSLRRNDFNRIAEDVCKTKIQLYAG